MSFREVTARISLNAATSGSLTGRKTSKIEHFESIILKQKEMIATKVICVFRVHTLNNYTFSASVCQRFTEINHQYFF